MVNGSNNHSSHHHQPEVFILKRSSNILFDNKRFADAALSISHVGEDELRARLASMPLDAYIESIPQSLLLLDTIYSKFYLFAARDHIDQSINQLLAPTDQFPMAILKPDRLVRQLIWFMTRELDPGGDIKKKGVDWKLIGPRLRNLLRVVHSMCPIIKRQLRVEKDEIEKALEGLGLHGLINFGDRSLIDIGEAVKQELSDHYHRVKALSQQVEKLMHKIAQQSEFSVANGGGHGKEATYSISDLRGPVPSQSSHQRLMNLRLSEIKSRLRRNEFMIQIVHTCLHNPDLLSLERILQKRIRYDRDILTQFAFLTRRNATYALASEDPVISHVLVLFGKGYERLLKLMPRSSTSNNDSGLGDDENEKSAPANGAKMQSRESVGTEENGRMREDPTHSSTSDDGTTAAATSIYTDPSAVPPSPARNQCNSCPISTPQSIPPMIHSDHLNNKPMLPPYFRRSFTSTTPIQYDFHGCRPLARNQPDYPRLSIFQQGPAIAHSGRSSYESLNLLPMNASDRVYSSMPCLQNNWMQLGPSCFGNGPGCGHICRNGPVLQSGQSSHQCHQATLDEQEKSELVRLREEVGKLQLALGTAQERLNKQQHQLNSQRFCNAIKTNNIHNRYSSQTDQSSELIDRYSSLYSTDRVETMLELNLLPELRDADDLQTKILLSVVVLSFRFVWQEIHKAKEDVWRALRENRSIHDVERDSGSPAGPLLHHLGAYMLEKAQLDKFVKTIWKVSDQLWQTLYDFSSLKSCRRLNEFIAHTCELAWRLSAAKPSYTIEFGDSEFDHKRHMRFHPSDLQAKRVKRFIWPALIESSTRKCVYKAVVIT